MRIKNVSFTASCFNREQLPEPNLPEIAMMGRSNVGKSSLINRLAARKNLARTSSTPGKTQSINIYLVDDLWNLVDLPGYGYAKAARTQRAFWGKLIEGYLLERPTLRGVVHLIDIRHAPMESDLLIHEWVRSQDIPVIVVATKMDKISRGQRLQHLKVIERDLRLTQLPLPVSSLTGDGLPELLNALELWLD